MALTLQLDMHIRHTASSKSALAGLSWTAGASTTLTDTGGFARAAATTNGVNAVIYKGPFLLVSGKTYKFNGQIYQRTAATNCTIRVSLSATLATSDFYTNAVSGGGNLSLGGVRFTANQTGNAYLGIIAGIVNAGEYSEIDDNISLVQN